MSVGPGTTASRYGTSVQNRIRCCFLLGAGLGEQSVTGFQLRTLLQFTFFRTELAVLDLHTEIRISVWKGRMMSSLWGIVSSGCQQHIQAEIGNRSLKMWNQCLEENLGLKVQSGGVTCMVLKLSYNKLVTWYQLTPHVLLMEHWCGDQGGRQRPLVEIGKQSLSLPLTLIKQFLSMPS